MTRQTTDRDLAPQRIDDTAYAYDPAGNITGITTASGQDTARTVDNQCFTTDLLGRLGEAWTTKTNCDTAPTTTTVGGPDAYWQTYSYDTLGNRTKLVEHATSAQTGTDATTTYTHPAAKAGLPHAVQQASVQGGANNGQTSTFTYDKAGNTTQRAIGTRTQNLTWDPEGHLATLTEAGKTTSYLYDADGNRMITKDADGSQTLTLPGGNELKATSTGTKQAVRYYTHGNETVAIRTGNGFSFLLPDHQGTAMAVVGMTTLAVTRRKQLPFGQTRTEESNQIPGTRGFVGGTNDPTGLTHLGAREYDPTLGRFLSVDPVIDINTPAQMNAYSYAHNNPITQSDPTGLCPADLCGNGYPIGGTGQVKGDPARYVKNASTGNRYEIGSYIGTNGKAISTPGKKSPQVAQAQARARAAEQAQAKDDKDKADAERRRQDGIWGNIIRGKFDAAWENTRERLDNTFGSSDWRNHWLVDKGIGFAAMAGTAACIASVACGAGLFAVGAAAIFAAGLGAHLSVSSEEERREGAGKFMLRTAEAEVKGMAMGTLFGRGMLGAIQKGGSLSMTRWAVKGGHARVNSIVTGPRQGGLPLLWRNRGLLK
ncbi:RHS repeat-associated core domain-containing protein [Streptomyces sp. 35G-GA-8]|nr:RHS repeat-associated core domain-containing protein [Streptomyces sp. 35G-GA-8]MCL7382292.1 RHS repeat-associated core domain-containing protein [Streptomyces sp. 35G-GA-8]